MDPLLSVLKRGYNQLKLPPFFILKNHSKNDDQSELLSWIKKFLSDILMEHYHCDLSSSLARIDHGHADILWIQKPKDEDYKIDRKDLDPFFKFQNWKPLELKWRFVIVESADLISDRYSNKLLKTLEEPAKCTTIFFIQGSSKKLLPTIESRAIKWKPLKGISLDLLNAQKLKSANEFLKYKLETHQDQDLKKLAPMFCDVFKNYEGLNILVDHIKKLGDKGQGLFDLLFEVFLLHEPDFKETQHFLDIAQSFYRDQVFHNPPEARWSNIIREMSGVMQRS